MSNKGETICYNQHHKQGKRSKYPLFGGCIHLECFFILYSKISFNKSQLVVYNLYIKTLNKWNMKFNSVLILIPSFYMVCDDDLPFVPILSNLTVYPPPLSLSLSSSQLLLIDRYGCRVSHLRRVDINLFFIFLMERIQHVMRFDCLGQRYLFKRSIFKLSNIKHIIRSY